MTWPGPVVRRRDLDDVEADERQLRARAQQLERLEATSGRPPRASRSRGRTRGRRSRRRSVRNAGPAGEPLARALRELRPGSTRPARATGSSRRPSSPGIPSSSAPYSGPRMPTCSVRAGSMMPLLDRAPEHRPVAVRAPVVGVPEVRVRVEVQQAELPVHARERAQLGERDRVVAAHAERDDAGLGDRPHEVLDPLQRVLDVAGHGRRVAEVDGRQLAEHLHALDGVVRADHARRRAHRLRPEAGAGAERRPAVPRHPEDGGVRALERRDVRQPRERPRSGEPRRLERIPWLVHHHASS